MKSAGIDHEVLRDPRLRTRKIDRIIEAIDRRLFDGSSGIRPGREQIALVSSFVDQDAVIGMSKTVGRFFPWTIRIHLRKKGHGRQGPGSAEAEQAKLRGRIVIRAGRT